MKQNRKQNLKKLKEGTDPPPIKQKHIATHPMSHVTARVGPRNEVITRKWVYIGRLLEGV